MPCRYKFAVFIPAGFKYTPPRRTSLMVLGLRVSEVGRSPTFWKYRGLGLTIEGFSSLHAGLLDRSVKEGLRTYAPQQQDQVTPPPIALYKALVQRCGWMLSECWVDELNSGSHAAAQPTYESSQALGFSVESAYDNRPLPARRMFFANANRNGSSETTEPQLWLEMTCS